MAVLSAERGRRGPFEGLEDPLKLREFKVPISEAPP